MNDEWRANLIERSDQIAELFRQTRRIAVLGIKTEAQSGQPAYYVPRYLKSAGFEIIPVPVYYPEVQEILGAPVFRSVAEIPDPVDMVVVFRRSVNLPPHLPDLLAAAPKTVWFQSGIRDDAVAAELARHGIQVVQDRCSMIEHRRLD